MQRKVLFSFKPFSGLEKRPLLPAVPLIQAWLNNRTFSDYKMFDSDDAFSCGEYSCTVVLGPTNVCEDELALIKLLGFYSLTCKNN